MYIAVFLIGLIVIFPFVLSIYVYYNAKAKRVYFAIYLFNKIKFTSGYIKIRSKGGFYVHLSEEKALIIDINTLKQITGGPDFLKYIEIDQVYIISDYGVKDINLLFFILAIDRAFKNYLKINNCANFRSDLNVFNKNEGIISIKIKFLCSFNLICILNSIFANYKSVGASYVKRKKREFKRAYS